MLKVPFDEAVDLFVDAGQGRFRRRVLHPNGRKLVGVQFPYLVVSVPLNRYTAHLNNVSHSPGRESAERIFENVAFSQFTTYVVEGEGLQHGDVVLWQTFVRCQKQKQKLRVDRRDKIQTLSASR